MYFVRMFLERIFNFFGLKDIYENLCFLFSALVYFKFCSPLGSSTQHRHCAFILITQTAALSECIHTRKQHTLCSFNDSLHILCLQGLSFFFFTFFISQGNPGSSDFPPSTTFPVTQSSVVLIDRWVFPKAGETTKPIRGCKNVGFFPVYCENSNSTQE